MKNLLIIGLVAVSGLANAQALTSLTAGDGSKYEIAASSYTTNQASTGTAGVHTVNFIPIGGTEYAFRNLYAFRQTGDTREFFVTSLSATFSSTADTFTASVNRAINNTGANTLNFEVKHKITDVLGAGKPLVISTIKVTNLSSNSTDVSFFNYMDFDIPGGGQDTITSNIPGPAGIRASMGDITVPGNYADVWAEGASRWRQGTLITTNFTNTTIDNLPNTVTAGSGDFGLTFQWEARTIAAGGTTTYTVYQSLNSPVPEPTTMIALAGGCLAMLRRRKNS